MRRTVNKCHRRFSRNRSHRGWNCRLSRGRCWNRQCWCWCRGQHEHLATRGTGNRLSQQARISQLTLGITEWTLHRKSLSHVGILANPQIDRNPRSGSPSSHPLSGSAIDRREHHAIPAEAGAQSITGRRWRESVGIVFTPPEFLCQLAVLRIPTCTGMTTRRSQRKIRFPCRWWSDRTHETEVTDEACQSYPLCLSGLPTLHIGSRRTDRTVVDPFAERGLEIARISPRGVSYSPGREQ